MKKTSLLLEIQYLLTQDEEDGDDYSSEIPLDADPPQQKLEGNRMIYTVMTIWLNRREKNCHDYSLVGFLISPNPVIMKDAVENNTKEHNKAIQILISKLFLDPILVGQAIVEARTDIFDTFCK